MNAQEQLAAEAIQRALEAVEEAIGALRGLEADRYMAIGGLSCARGELRRALRDVEASE